MQDERFIVSYPQTGRGMMPAPAHRERMEFFWYLESLQGHCKDIINPYLITEKKKKALSVLLVCLVVCGMFQKRNFKLE